MTDLLTIAPFDMEDTAAAIRTWLDDADRILITAGAGLSAAAGHDYGDSARFRELFPALHRLGLRSRYLVGVPLPPALLWGASASARSSSTTRTSRLVAASRTGLTTAPVDTRLLILEFGAGFNTPGVIRRPGEHIARHFPRARLVRVNPDHPDVPAGLGGRALAVPIGADHLISVLHRAGSGARPHGDHHERS